MSRRFLHQIAATTVAAAVAATAFTASADAQTRNATLLGRFDQYQTYNDIWGYAAPDGREYALLGTTTGMAVIDCSNPSSPQQRGFFPWASSTWRDIRTYSTYAYVSSEGGGGFQIIDLTNPDAPVSLGIFAGNRFSNAHNVCIDTGTGLLYMAGASSGTPVFDLAANPRNPPYVGLFTGSGNSNYFHDLCVENGYAYGSMIYNGDLRITDVRNGIPGNVLSNTQTPSNFTHNAWPNAAGTLCVTTDERGGGVIKLYDITNKSAPRALGQFTPNPVSTPHNAFIVGDLCHVSWYTEGYQCIDISDPNNPVQVASYDTWLGASGGFNGCWGVYPFQPSGNIYLSDISSGLYIVRPQITDLDLTHTPLVDTTDEDGPYTVLATVTGTNPLQSIELTYQIDGGADMTVPMMPTGAPNQYSADIPGQDAVSTIDYFVAATDTVATRRSPQDGRHRFQVGTFVQIWLDDFETDRGWTSVQVSNQNDWQRGSPAGRSGTSGGFAWNDPSSAFSGSNVLANDLGNTGFNGAYQNNNSNYVQSVQIPTGGASGLRLRYRRSLSLNSGDSARVLINNVLVWVRTQPIQDSSWVEMSHDISGIVGSAPTVTIRFDMQADRGGVAGGWTLDDVEILAASDESPPSFYGNATAGTGGIDPAIDLLASAQIGSTAQVGGSNMLANAGSFLLLNFGSNSQPVFGFELLVATSALTAIPQTASPAGAATWPLAIPTTPSIDNLYLYGQVLVVDSGSAGGTFAASNGMRFRIHQF